MWRLYIKCAREYVLSIEHIGDTAHVTGTSLIRTVRSFIRLCAVSQRETGFFLTYMPTLSPDHRPFPPWFSSIVAKNGRNQQKEERRKKERNK